jgi:L-glutamine:scyllo-inosose aminotransferase/L-glutamine:2-deoxy-scyllo-inosose/3-amino-2,3-dideoxy-scyllo-inosose aminotransferase
MVALEALGVGANDEVIVPGLTWVASASAVASINAIPVLADVDPSTFCLTASAVESALTERTKAITVVHLYSAVADLDGLLQVADRYAMPLLEDCAQAHGAAYAGKRVGTLGAAGAFSMQSSKLLTSGEGGAIVTSDEAVARRAEHLRADGRTFASGAVREGQMELVETAELMGNNACLSEIQAAVLLAQLEDLDAQNRARQAGAAAVTADLTERGCTVQSTTSETTSRSYYRYAFQVPDDLVHLVPIERLAAALSAELGFPITPTHRPLNANPLYEPSSRPRFHTEDKRLARLDPTRFVLPHATAIHQRTLTFGHEVLLAPPDTLHLIGAAFDKVIANAHDLAS